MKAWLVAILCGLVLGLGNGAWAQGKTEILWYGHAAFKITTPQGRVLFIDPWLVNPVNPDGQADLDAIQQADLVLVSHGHFDHVGNAGTIIQNTGARLVATYDLGNALAAYGQIPASQMGFDTMGNFGGSLSFFDGEIDITFVPAVHSSSVNAKAMGLSEDDEPEYGGHPGGFLIRIQGGPTIYHTGDTDLYGDMALIRKPVDVMLACIGDHFTMGPERAAQAVSLVSPRVVIPMHYGTFPTVLTGTVEDFRAELKARRLDDRLLPLALETPQRF